MIEPRLEMYDKLQFITREELLELQRVTANDFQFWQEECHRTGDQEKLYGIGMMLVRMSFLKWRGRIETPEELAELMPLYKLKGAKKVTTIDDLI